MGDEIPFIRGDRTYSVGVAGTGDHRDSSDALCGERRMQRVNIRTRAHMRTQDECVSVVIQGHVVGHLSYRDARALDRMVRYGDLSKYEVFECAAIIRGGWDGEHLQSAAYTVSLDLPLKDS